MKKSPPWFKPFLLRFTRSSKSFDFLRALVAVGDIVRLPTFKSSYLVNDPNAIQHIFQHNMDNYTKIGTSFERVEGVVGKGMLTNSGEEWARRRQALQPQFHSKNLSNFIPIIEKHTQRLLHDWEGKKGRTFLISDDILSAVMNISAQSLLGVDISDRSHELVRMIHTLNDYAVRSFSFSKWLPSFKNLRYQLAKKTIDRFLLTSLAQRKPIDPVPLLDSLFQKDEKGHNLLSEEEYLGEVKNFLIAGFDTTGNAIGWTLFFLAKNSYVLAQVLEEINSKKPIEEANYLEMAINESLRLCPPIWIITRKSIQEDHLLEYTIPANSLINVCPYLLHRHPKYWHNPEIYYPERFLPEVSRTRPKYAFIPFGLGPRVCIGRQFAMMVMKIIITRILERFEIELPSRSYTVRLQPLITLKPLKGIWLKCRLREDKKKQPDIKGTWS